ncbi:MAG: bifunctional phosphoribosylaminoimidazolecarboxamide formyltransferase/IMP cyclohydrolase [Flavobacteriales bacterium]
MAQNKRISNALISVFDKEGLGPIAKKLAEQGVTIYSTGGTQSYIEGLGISVEPVEELTSYPSILGGRVKTLHPKVFGGILSRRELAGDIAQLEEYAIPELDLVMVDLYPFENTVASGAAEKDVIEKIDIGGISLIRAAAKNFKDVVIVPSKDEYGFLQNMLDESGAESNLDQRKFLAKRAFEISSHYDSAIFTYFDENETSALKLSQSKKTSLRYGENPHQKGAFFGDLDQLFTQLHGKSLSYNNLLDVDAAVQLMDEFSKDKPTFAILKHTNACGLAVRDSVVEAYEDALAGDPVSAFGGVLICNQKIDPAAAEKINTLFCEVVIAPGYEETALETLKSKKNRVILIQKEAEFANFTVRTALNGYLFQEKDERQDSISESQLATENDCSAQEKLDLEFAAKLVKHTKSNTIVFSKNNQLCASGTGQTSRVDALNQAITKAKAFGFDLNGAVMASDAFFPFPDCVEIAHKEGVNAVVQPGGSIKDKLSIDYCNAKKMAMYFTGTRHFKH